ncbi:MAG: hypothetical protein QOG83_876 [Alphaproteobacteria bacterium]|nr:hypothetical protein [Alphaproteobacteria bacterium]
MRREFNMCGRAVVVAALVGLPLCGSFAHLAAAADGDPVVSGESLRQRVLERLPDSYLDRIKQKRDKIQELFGQNRQLAAIPNLMVILESNKWTPGKTVKVAFNGGNSRLHELIARAASEWADYANIKFDFGRDADGNYRLWSADDKDYAADVRISFSNPGYWSILGSDSSNPDIAQPYQPSMNFEGFDKGLPFDWAGVVRHEFGHALSVQHEHQHPKVDCGWRWDDEDGYEMTTNDRGEFTRDPLGHFPGIYRWMGGPPNNWPKSQVDFNVRALQEDESAFGFGEFDKLSIMKYYFPDRMYVQGKDSVCYTGDPNNELSAEDKARIAEFYPKDPAVVAARVNQQKEALAALLSQVPKASTIEQELQLKLQQWR